MQIVIGVRFRTNPKVYYFNPGNETYAEGDNVVVETARGIEFGTVALANKEVEDKCITGELKTVLRKATDKDKKTAESLLEKKDYALKIATDKVKARGIKLKLVDCEYTFDGKKVILYFTADGRVDFRELVRDLASVLKTRIELRQIYERDDIKMRGALAVCGRPCCCGEHLPDYEKVSIKMAKIQGLSLSPTKISGICGKLMCCLKYENDYYVATLKEMPKQGSRVITPDGEGVVDNNDLIRKQVTVRFYKDELVTFKKYEIAEIGGGEKPTESEVAEDADETSAEDSVEDSGESND